MHNRAPFGFFLHCASCLGAALFDTCFFSRNKNMRRCHPPTKNPSKQLEEGKKATKMIANQIEWHEKRAAWIFFFLHTTCNYDF